MTPLDDRLSQAVTDLRGDVDTLETPSFAPRRSTAPAMLALVLLLGIGFAVASSALPGSDNSGGVSVATQPEQADVPDGEPASSEVRPDSEPEASPDAGIQSENDDQQVLTGQFSASEAGEFLMPLPAGAAWSPDESRLLMYRTGTLDPGHFVADTETGQVIGATPLPFTAADIEQVYWHPDDADVLLYTSGVDVMAYDLSVGQSQVLASFDECDRVDSGVLPVPPASDGTFSLLCHSGEQRDLLVYDLGTGQSLRAPTTGDSAAMPSVSGRNLVRWNSDGSASVLDASLAETGVTLDLDNNLFVLVADDDRREWAATTLFDGPAIGSIVLLPLDGASDPVVIIGPDQGDPYPPTGTSISAGDGVVAVAIPGVDDGGLAGRITAVDVSNVLSPTIDLSIAHYSADLHGYWSGPFVSVSPSGQFVAYSSDSASDSVDSFIAAVAEPA